MLVQGDFLWINGICIIFATWFLVNNRYVFLTIGIILVVFLFVWHFLLSLFIF